jgi:F-type H+-transporting ATPase subunit gamma
MAVNPKEIKRRIKGVTSTKQITKTMEMVAASKMRKAQQAANQVKAYAEKALQILNSMAGKTGHVTHPLLVSRPIKKTIAIVLTSDRGLCGGLNSGVIAKILEWSKTRNKETLEFITLGKKGRDTLSRFGFKVIADFSGLKKYEFVDIWPLISMAMQSYTAGEADEVVIIYPQFINTLVQKPRVRPLLPLSEENIAAIMEELAGKIEMTPVRDFEFKFEPDANAVLQNMLPRLTEMQIFKTVLETQASEHSARMTAMKSATDAASDIIDDLTSSYNQARQASITREIAEISSAAEALK